MKTWKKNLMAAAVLVTVCSGIYLNWLYTEQTVSYDLTKTLNTEKVMSDDLLILNGDQPVSGQVEQLNTAGDYFAAVRLSRQKARDSAVDLLQEAISCSGDSKEAESSAELGGIIETALSEAQIESLIIAKGYTDCVAYMSDGAISVAVAAPEGGLQQEDVAVIADIVMTQSGLRLQDIRVVEVR